MMSGIEQEAVFKRIRQNCADHQERLMSLFEMMYNNSAEALEKWKQLIAEQGFEKIYKQQRRRACILGKLRGRALWKIFVSWERQKAKQANAEFGKIAHAWHRSVLEEEDFQHRQSCIQEQMVSDENHKLIEQLRVRVHLQITKFQRIDLDAQMLTEGTM